MNCWKALKCHPGARHLQGSNKSPQSLYRIFKTQFHNKMRVFIINWVFIISTNANGAADMVNRKHLSNHKYSHTFGRSNCYRGQQFWPNSDGHSQRNGGFKMWDNPPTLAQPHTHRKGQRGTKITAAPCLKVWVAALWETWKTWAGRILSAWDSLVQLGDRMGRLRSPDTTGRPTLLPSCFDWGKIHITEKSPF